MFGYIIRFQIIDVLVVVLFIFVVVFIGIYGVVLVGWLLVGMYFLFGLLCFSVQMIFYEVVMGLFLVMVFIFFGLMLMLQIVEFQVNYLVVGGFDIYIVGYYWLLLILSFVIYVIMMFGELNCLFFDLLECELEFVSGYIIEYLGFFYGMYFLVEYINMVILLVVCIMLFLGGYCVLWLLNYFGVIDLGWWGLLWFFFKIQFVIFFFVWVCVVILRFCYDYFMDLGWKVFILVLLGWVLMIVVWCIVIN